MSNLRYEMKCQCLNKPYADGSGKQITDHDSEKTYRKGINYFCDWLKEQYGVNTSNQLDKAGGAKSLIEEYIEKLKSEGKSSATIHTYVSPVAKGLGIHLDELNLPKRRALDITRSRDMERNHEGRQQANDPNGKYSRLIDFQKMVGIRRSELAKLHPNSICRDESGYLCVQVIGGKGNKDQMQRILPEDEKRFQNFWKNILKSVSESDKPRDQIKIFTKEEMETKADLHGIRAEHARRSYEYYKDRCKTKEGEQEVQKELVMRWNAMHGKADQIIKTQNGYEGTSSKAKKFINEFSRPGQYQLRGENRIRAMELGRSVSLNRTAVLASSVFSLSHWRTEIFVRHYWL